MSIRVLAHIWQCDLPAAEMLFLQALGDCANDQFLAHPSWNYLAWKTGLSRRTISSFVKKFRDKGVLIPAGELTRSVVYRIKLAPLPMKKPWRSVRNLERIEGERDGATTAPLEQLSMVQPLHSDGATHCNAIRKNRH